MLKTSHEVMVILSFLRQKNSFIFYVHAQFKTQSPQHSNCFSLWKTMLKQHILVCYTSSTCLAVSFFPASTLRTLLPARLHMLRWTWPTHYINCSSYHPTLYWHHYNDMKKVVRTLPKSLKIWGHFACDQRSSLSSKLLTFP